MSIREVKLNSIPEGASKPKLERMTMHGVTPVKSKKVAAATMGNETAGDDAIKMIEDFEKAPNAAKLHATHDHLWNMQEMGDDVQPLFDRLLSHPFSKKYLKD